MVKLTIFHLKKKYLAMTGISLTIVLASLIYPSSLKYNEFFFPQVLFRTLLKIIKEVWKYLPLLLRTHKNVGSPSKMLVGVFARGDIKCGAGCVTDLRRHCQGQPLVSVSPQSPRLLMPLCLSCSLIDCSVRPAEKGLISV